ncbi:hypothetical protein AB6A40_005149, partial [Gnathostoma spinigerum]
MLFGLSFTDCILIPFCTLLAEKSDDAVQRPNITVAFTDVSTNRQTLVKLSRMTELSEKSTGEERWKTNAVRLRRVYFTISVPQKYLEDEKEYDKIYCTDISPKFYHRIKEVPLLLASLSEGPLKQTNTGKVLAEQYAAKNESGAKAKMFYTTNQEGLRKEQKAVVRKTLIRIRRQASLSQR